MVCYYCQYCNAGSNFWKPSLVASIEKLRILLVDQEIRKALKISDYVYVLELGRNKYEGPTSEFTDLEKAFWIGG